MRKIKVLSLMLIIMFAGGCYEEMPIETPNPAMEQTKGFVRTKLQSISNHVYASTSNSNDFVALDNNVGIICNSGIDGAVTNIYSTYNFDVQQNNVLGSTGYTVVGSGAVVMMDDCYYESHITVDPDSQDEKLEIIKVDINNNQVSTLAVNERINEINPLIYLSKLNKDEFIFMINSKAESTIQLFDCNTDTWSEIVSESLSSHNNTYVGKYIFKACCIDNEIYALVANKSENDISYSIDIYGGNGNYKKSISANVVSSILRNSDPLLMYGIGNYIGLVNWNFESGLYFIEDNKLVKIGDGIIFCGGMSNFCDSSKSQFIYYWERNKSDNSKTITLSALKTDTGEIRRTELDFGNDLNIAPRECGMSGEKVQSERDFSAAVAGNQCSQSAKLCGTGP